jgi:hypothetical protein
LLTPLFRYFHVSRIPFMLPLVVSIEIGCKIWLRGYMESQQSSAPKSPGLFSVSNSERSSVFEVDSASSRLFPNPNPID